ncbi:hypothetical protein AVEN_188817-1 [Araneus ventricosus]|uniref:Uncharacterized protein n=1 Tax=Araneus ventricosus TaxID=182803 RepID=A0A4Y2BSZ6_ARAVE|nr:hypothetical protein AVEN_188817-1 [Araneus ventricosus]
MVFYSSSEDGMSLKHLRRYFCSYLIENLTVQRHLRDSKFQPKITNCDFVYVVRMKFYYNSDTQEVVLHEELTVHQSIPRNDHLEQGSNPQK